MNCTFDVEVSCAFMKSFQFLGLFFLNLDLSTIFVLLLLLIVVLKLT